MKNKILVIVMTICIIVLIGITFYPNLAPYINKIIPISSKETSELEKMGMTSEQIEDEYPIITRNHYAPQTEDDIRLLNTLKPEDKKYRSKFNLLLDGYYSMDLFHTVKADYIEKQDNIPMMVQSAIDKDNHFAFLQYEMGSLKVRFIFRENEYLYINDTKKMFVRETPRKNEKGNEFFKRALLERGNMVVKPEIIEICTNYPSLQISEVNENNRSLYKINGKANQSDERFELEVVKDYGFLTEGKRYDSNGALIYSLSAQKLEIDTPVNPDDYNLSTNQYKSATMHEINGTGSGKK